MITEFHEMINYHEIYSFLLVGYNKYYIGTDSQRALELNKIFIIINIAKSYKLDDSQECDNFMKFKFVKNKCPI